LNFSPQNKLPSLIGQFQKLKIANLSQLLPSIQMEKKTNRTRIANVSLTAIKNHNQRTIPVKSRSL
jgi:hypothetical protein